MSKQILRLYNMEDEAMLVNAQVMHNNFIDDLALFTAKFPFLTAAFGTAFQTSITTAEALPLDGQITDMLHFFTEDANAQLILGNAALQYLDTYVKYTYKDEYKQHIFGQAHWNEARSDKEKMINALEEAHDVATKIPYSTELLASGYTAINATQLTDIANNLHVKNSLQKDAKSERKIETQTRVLAYNTVWNNMQTINLCSKVVFADNPAKLEQYMLYPYSTENTHINIIVLDAANAPIKDAKVTLTNTPLATDITVASGLATFDSVNMPDLIDIHIEDTINGNTADYNSQTVQLGETNNFTLHVPL